MSAKLSHIVLVSIFQVLIFTLLSCQNKSNRETDGTTNPSTIEIPTEERVISTAKDFVRTYMKRKNAEAFLIQAEDIMNGDYSPIFNIHQGRWYVFFTDGIYSLDVTMNNDLSMGTVRGLNEKIISSQAGAENLKGDYSDLPLFTILEFKEAVDMPHNK